MKFFRLSKRTAIAIFFITWMVVVSCGDIFNQDDYEFKQIDANPSFSVPVAFGDLSIADILDQADSQYVKVYSDGLVYLEYDQVLKSQAIRDLISIPDKSNVSTNLSVPAATYPANVNDYNSTTVSKFVTFNIPPGEEQLTEIFLKSGTLACDVSLSPPNANFKYAVNLTIPEFTKGGVPFSIVAGSTTGQSFSLKDYVYQSGVANRITLNYTLVIKKNPNPVTIPPGTTANTSISFLNFQYKYTKGFFGDQVADLTSDVLDIEAFGTSLKNVNNLGFGGIL